MKHLPTIIEEDSNHDEFHPTTTPQPPNDPKPGLTTNPIPLPQENEMSIDISVNDNNADFDLYNDDDESYISR